MAAVRQAIVDWSHSNKVEWVWFVDDETEFGVRPVTNNITVKAMGLADYERMHERIASFTSTVMIGIGRHTWLRHPEQTETETITIFAVWAIMIGVI
jgi:hypothetical protein